MNDREAAEILDLVGRIREAARRTRNLDDLAISFRHRAEMLSGLADASREQLAGLRAELGAIIARGPARGAEQSRT